MLIQSRCLSDHSFVLPSLPLKEIVWFFISFWNWGVSRTLGGQTCFLLIIMGFWLPVGALALQVEPCADQGCIYCLFLWIMCLNAAESGLYALVDTDLYVGDGWCLLTWCLLLTTMTPLLPANSSTHIVLWWFSLLRRGKELRAPWFLSFVLCTASSPWPGSRSSWAWPSIAFPWTQQQLFSMHWPNTVAKTLSVFINFLT